ncbi:MAG TPA: tetratricopeptide repeat protein [Bacteroidales bacterium]|nr:tetratricopeptide repeat protein [Bacteroidales bacterium]
MKRKTFFILILFFIAPFSLKAQNSSLDSFLIVHENKHDTVKMQLLLNEYFPKYRRGIVSDGEECLEKALEIAEKYDDLWMKGIVLIKFGDYNKTTGDHEKAIEYYTQALNVFEKFKKEKTFEKKAEHNLASIYNNLGATYQSMGKYEEAMSNLIKSLGFYETMNDSSGLAKTYTNLGLLYFDHGEFDKSLEFYNKSLTLKRQLNDLRGIALLYNNIAIVNYYTENYDSVRYYFQQSYEIYVDMGDRRNQVMALSNLAEIYAVLGQKDKALKTYFEVLKIEDELKERAQMAKTYFIIADLYSSRSNFKEAKSYLYPSLNLAKEASSLIDIRNAYSLLTEIYKEERDYKTALKYNELYCTINDSIFNAEKLRQIKEIETQYETRKKEQRIKNLENEKIISDLRIKRQQFLIFSVILGLLIISSFILVLFNRNKKIRLANDKLSYQKKQITDSIEYASKIQTAILPPDDYITQLIPQHFIFYKPRDIVSGDFYWVTEKNNKIVVAVVDCTGHGVPGAFMSMLGTAFLNEIVNSDFDQKANSILNQLRNYIKKSLHQTGKDDETKDGMDISLCIIDKNKGTLQFAGAYNSLFLISNNKPLMIKGDRMPIGIYMKEKDTFTNHEIDIQPGDMFYLFTDGYIDQFGGDNRRKFRIAPFRELLFSVHLKPVEEQKKILEASFNAWKGQLEQIDDVLVFGFRI